MNLLNQISKADDVKKKKMYKGRCMKEKKGVLAKSQPGIRECDLKIYTKTFRSSTGRKDMGYTQPVKKD